MPRETYRSVAMALRAALSLPSLADYRDATLPILPPTELPSLRDVRLIARGGMGSVYQAFDEELKQEVAVKVVRAGKLDAGLGERLRREAHVLSVLRHPGIVRLLRVEERGPHLFLILELVRGPTLTRYLRHESSLRARLSTVLACGDALCAAHAAGFAHRDFKPDNVLVRPDGTPCLLDFGLSRAMGDARAEELVTITRTGQVLGTASYMAPEQKGGERGDAASDQYSLALVLQEALRKEEHSAAVETLHAVLERMLSANPDDRFATLEQALRDARAALP